MAKITIHGVCVNSEAFKTAKSVKDANLFAHLGEGSKQAENDLIEVLGIVTKKEKVEEVVVDEPKNEINGTEWPKETI